MARGTLDQWKKVGKLEEIADLNITGICETRYVGNEDFTNEGLRIILNENEKGGRNGLAVILRGEWKNMFLTHIIWTIELW